jgi:uncharacterized membrane protein YfcA
VIAGILLLAGGAAAGLFGALLGLGGGVLIVPLLTLGIERPLREAVAVSLVCVIVTRAPPQGVLRSRTANLRLGMVLVLFTAIGALAGASLALARPGAVGAVRAAPDLRGGRWRGLLSRPAAPPEREPVLADGAPAMDPAGRLDTPAPSDRRALDGALDGPLPLAPRPGRSPRWGRGRGRAVRRRRRIVNAHDAPPDGRAARVAAATSNLMMGVTAVSSAIIYLLRGGLDPYLAGPTALGVFVGASVGARVAHRVDIRIIRGLFVVVLAWTAFQMARRALEL